jgi:hypothetical protein
MRATYIFCILCVGKDEWAGLASYIYHESLDSAPRTIAQPDHGDDDADETTRVWKSV